ncbi:MAG: hypothetical protein K8R90_03960 [Candidatus Cloacimonetes bacterium]|nr:hypothetical protein [Candidatus Cloacimonadota bacterium]
MIVEIDEQKAIERIEKIARFLVERNMAVPAIMGIESVKPLNFLGSQVLYFVAPFAELIFNASEYQEFAALIERDEYVELLLKRLEHLDNEMHHEERQRARMLRKRRLNRFKRSLGRFFGKK